jgi:hypothetical protein
MDHKPLDPQLKIRIEWDLLAQKKFHMRFRGTIAHFNPRINEKNGIIY